MATGTSGDERDDDLTASNDEALAAEEVTSTSGSTDASLVDDEAPADDVDDELVAEDADEPEDDEADADDEAEAVAAGATKSGTAKTRGAKARTAKTATKPAEKSRTKRDAAKKPAKGERTGLAKFVHEVWVELKKVVTPTRRELWRYVAVVLGFLLIMMAIVTFLDFFFGFVSSWVFGNGTDLFPAGPPAVPGDPGAPAPVDPGAPVPGDPGAPAPGATP